MAINTVTNKVYLTGPSGITVIDGTTHATTTLQFPPGQGLIPRDSPEAKGENSIGVNEVTNKIYIATGYGIFVIDGVTDSITTVVDPNAYGPWAVAVNPVTNKIYVVNSGNDANATFHFSNVTVIDGGTNVTTTVTDPNATKLGSIAIAVNTTTNKVYVVNDGNNVTVIDGATNSTTTVTMGAGFRNGSGLGSAIAVNPTTNRIYTLTTGPIPANGGFAYS